MSKSTRCKFVCDHVTRHQFWQDRTKFLFSAKFRAVTDGSEENKAFWAATPSGSLEVGTVSQDIFVPGQAYYIDITPAEG